MGGMRTKRLPNQGGNIYARRRRAARLTQRDIAEMAGCSRSLVSLIEAGDRKCPERVQMVYMALAARGTA